MFTCMFASCSALNGKPCASIIAGDPTSICVHALKDSKTWCILNIKSQTLYYQHLFLRLAPNLRLIVIFVRWGVGGGGSHQAHIWLCIVSALSPHPARPLSTPPLASNAPTAVRTSAPSTPLCSFLYTVTRSRCPRSWVIYGPPPSVTRAPAVSLCTRWTGN